MTDWCVALSRPPGLRDDSIHTWFDRIAERMLNRSRLMVGDAAYRFTEIECYYHGPDHFDAFTHRDSLQKDCGRWYLHRSGGTLRNGSFKGLDLTFGDENAHAGILIRGLETADGTLIDGPSLCVDHLIAASGATSLSQLDRMLAEHRAWDDDSVFYLHDFAAKPSGWHALRYSEGRGLPPIANHALRSTSGRATQTMPARRFGRKAHLHTLPEPEARPLFRSGRVGLSLKTAHATSDLPRYLCRPLRYLTEPRRIAKGRLYLLLALHAQGTSIDAIRTLTGCSKATLARYVADFEMGRICADFTPFFGKATTPADLCRLHGVWHALHGTGIASIHPSMRHSVTAQLTGGVACPASS